MTFEQYWKINSKDIRNFCSILSRNHRDKAEELYAETMIRTWKNFDKYNGKSQFKTWVFRIAQNLHRDTGRNARRRPTYLPETEATEKHTAFTDPGFEAVLEKELVKNLFSKLHLLTPIEREILDLHCIQDLTCEEIAPKLHIPVSTVRTRVYRAKVKARLFLR